MKHLLKTILFSSVLALITQAAFAGAPKPLSVTIKPKGDLLMFDVTEIKAKAGQKIKLTLDNTSGMQHNWVLVKPGTEAAVAQAGIIAGAAAGWLNKTADVLVATKLVDAKKKETIEFDAPAKGDYPFICTFPGHAGTMKGILKVE